MKIRFLTRVSSSIYGSHKPGDVFDWKDDAEAKQLIAAGMAEVQTNQSPYAAVRWTEVRSGEIHRTKIHPTPQETKPKRS